MKITQNTFIVYLVSLIIILISHGCAELTVNPEINGTTPNSISGYKYSASESFTFTTELTTQTIFTVEGINGEVNVESVPGTDHISVSGEKIVSSDTYQDANSHLSDITIDINKAADEISVHTVQPQFSEGRSYNVNYTISIPDHLNILVKNVNGKISGNLSVPLNGTVVLNLANGSIELKIPQSTSANLLASIVNGSIATQNIIVFDRIETGKSLQGRLGEGEGVIDLRTVNGNVVVSGYYRDL